MQLAVKVVTFKPQMQKIKMSGGGGGLFPPNLKSCITPWKAWPGNLWRTKSPEKFQDVIRPASKHCQANLNDFHFFADWLTWLGHAKVRSVMWIWLNSLSRDNSDYSQYRELIIFTGHCLWISSPGVQVVPTWTVFSASVFQGVLPPP